MPELYSWLALAGGLLSLACYAFPVAVMAIVGLLGYGAVHRRRWAVCLGVLLLLSWGLVITTFWIDPGDVLEWYFD